MKYYTIQSPVVWKQIESRGKWVTDHHYYMFPEEYNWILDQMERRIKIHNPSRSLIWLWGKRPDLRRSGYGARGESMVLLEVQIEKECVLASDFNAWHFVLNDTFFGDEEKENIKKEETWPRIFDLEFCKKFWGEEEEQYLQYVTGELPKTKVKLVREFTCR